MHLQKITIKNFKRISELEKEVQGNNVFVVGPNNSGKSSFLQAVYLPLTDEKMPPDPLTVERLQKEPFYNPLSGDYENGESVIKQSEKGELVVEFGDEEKLIKAELRFTKQNPKGKLNVEINGEKQTSPKTVLKDLIGGHIDFDPFDFLSWGDDKKVKFVKDILGLDFTDLDDSIKETYDKRKEISQQIKQIEGDIEAEELKDHDFEVFQEKKDDTEIKQKLNSVNEQNKKLQSEQEKLNQIRSDYKAKQQEITNTQEKESSVDKEIAELKEKLRQKREEKQQLSDQQNTLKEELNQLYKQGEEQRAVVENFEIPDVSELNRQLEEIQNFNRKVEQVQKVAEQRKKVENLKQYYEDLSGQIKDYKQEKRERMKQVDWPIQELDISEDDKGRPYLVYNGLPVNKEQLSTSLLIDIGIKLMMASSPNLKICRIKDGSMLDSNSLNELLTVINNNGYQAFVEQVQDTDNLQIEVTEEASDG